MADIVLPHTDPLLNAASWTKHQVAVTKVKDSERDTLSYFAQCTQHLNHECKANLLRVTPTHHSYLFLFTAGDPYTPTHISFCLLQVTPTHRWYLFLFTAGDPYTPLVSLQNFQSDDESIVDEDLVAWVTLGVHHLPTAEDIPVTTTGQSSVHSQQLLHFCL